MECKYTGKAVAAFCFLVALGLSACQTSTVTEGTTGPEATGIEHTESDTVATRRLSPERVDVRGFIIRERYNQGQVTIEVEGTASQYVRYNRAVVLVPPTTQILGIAGKPAGLNDLRQGQYVAILLRSGGRGNLEGVGIARKIWIEKPY